MIKKSLLLLILTLVALLLVSCKVKGNTDKNDANEKAVFGSGINTKIVTDSQLVDLDMEYLLLEIEYKIDKISGASAEISDDTSQATAHEIVIGASDREISSSAVKALERAVNNKLRDEENPDEQILGFAVYAKNGSVAIVYNDDRMKERAVNYFIENFLGGDELVLEDGYVHSRLITLLEYLREGDSEREAREWAEVESVLGAEAKEALLKHYELFDERFYLWLADLYDPTTGGFYCTNAARDNEGYLPDIQSTAQVLAFLDNSGMTKSYGGWQYALPAEITDEIAEFVKKLQSPADGYFYHPQWEGLEYTASRLGRDVTWASEILKPLYNLYSEKYTEEGYGKDEVNELLKKYMPYWDTPGGLKGSKGKPGASAVCTRGMTVCLGESAKNAVSAVVASKASSSWTPQLRSLDSWRAYLYGGTADGVIFAGLDLEGDSYTVGNTLAAQVSQIKQRDIEAREKGERAGYEELTKKFLDDGVKAHNGLWEDEVKYNSVNGLMKIVSVYNGMHWELLYPDKAMASAIEVSSYTTPDIDDKEPVAAVDVYNPWVCISGIFTNVSLYNKTLNKSEFESVWRSAVKENAADMIKGTTAKIAKFSKDDGSYGYHWGAPPVHAQGMPVTVSGIVCGDIDGACVSSTGTLSRMCDALGLSDAPCLFDSEDMEIFSRRLMGHGAIIKNVEVDTDVFVYDFEDGAAGSEYHYAKGNVGKGIRTVKDNGLDDYSNRLMLSITDTDPLTGVTTTFESLGLAHAKADCYILEFDIYLEDIKKGDYLEIKIGAGATAAYMLTMEGKDDGGASLGDNSGGSGSIRKSFGKSIPKKEWHTVRIEYYVNDTSEIVIKNYLDGNLIYNSDNYYGRRVGAASEHDPVYDKATFYSTYDSTATYYLDNITVERAKKAYVAEAVYNPNRVKDFESGLPTGVKAPDASVVADPNAEGNSVLRADGTVTVNTTEHLTPANAFVFETDIYASRTGDGEIATIYMTSGIASESVYALNLSAVTEGEERFIELYTATRSGVTDEVMGKAILQSKFKLRIEYYRYQYSDNYSKIKTIVYINGVESGRSETGYYLYNVARDYNKLIFKTAGGAEVYLDNLISENDKIAFRDADGNVIADPKNPVFPMGGAGGTKEPDESYNGRIDFEDAFLGIPSIPGLTTKPNSNEFGNDIEVAQDPENADNKALLISTVSSTRAGNRALVVPYDAMVGANCYVLEWDMYIADGSVPYYQFKLGDCFMLELRGSTTLRILTKSSNPTDGSGRIEALLGKGHKLTADEWHNIRIEYYCGTAETVKILVYVDGSVYETNHFYGKGANIVGEPTNSYDTENPVVFYSAYDCSADVYFDNIVAEKIIKDYPVIDNGDPDVPDGGGDGSDPDDPGEGGGTGTDKPEGGTEKPTEPDENGGIEINPDYVPSEGEPLPDDINPNWSNP